MIFKYILFIFCLLSSTSVFANPNCDRVQADMQVFDTNISQMKSEFAKHTEDINDKNWVTLKITHMYDMDQYMRETAVELPHKQQYSVDEAKCFWDVFMPRWQDIDTTNTSDLKKLMKVYKWFWISEFGERINNHAWALAQHADLDRPFQKEVLAILKEAYPTGEVKAKDYAFLYDRVTWFGDGNPQRYATQGQCIEKGNWQPFPTEDFANVNKRRKEMGMNPFEENKARIDKICY